jgi:hypothetical protein
MRPQMRSFAPSRAAGIGMQSQGRTGARSDRQIGSFGGSSIGRSSPITAGSFRSSSQSFGGGGRTRGRSSGSRRSGSSSRGSFSVNSDERRNSDSLTNTGRNQRLGSRGMESGVNKSGTGNGREPSGKARSNQGLNTHLQY